MNRSGIPWFVLALCYGSGALLVVLGVPLMCRRVAPNCTYGVRFASTLADERVWYDINARGGRDLIIIGALYIVIQTLVLMFGSEWSVDFQILVPLAVLVFALLVDAIALAIAAGRLLEATRGGENPGSPS